MARLRGTRVVRAVVMIRCPAVLDEAAEFGDECERGGVIGRGVRCRWGVGSAVRCLGLAAFVCAALLPRQPGCADVRVDRFRCGVAAVVVE